MGIKKIKHTAKKTALCVGGSPLNIPKDNLVLLRYHPGDRNKIQDNYKSELFLVLSKHKDPNVYTMHPLCGGLVCMVNQQQLFDLKKSSLVDSGDTDPTDSSAPKTILPFFQPKKIKTEKDTPHQHLYGTRSKTQTNAVVQALNIGDDSVADIGFQSLVSSMFVPWI